MTLQNNGPVTRYGAGARRAKAFRARRRRGEHWAHMVLSEAKIDHLADLGYLDGENTVDEALALFLADHMP